MSRIRAVGEEGVAAFDSHTPLHFGAGFVAGISGWKPAMVLLSFVALELAYAAASVGAKKALFHAHKQAPINEIADLIVEITGYYVGAGLRAARQQKQAPAPPLQQPAPTPAAGIGHWEPYDAGREGRIPSYVT